MINATPYLTLGVGEPNLRAQGQMSSCNIIKYVVVIKMITGAFKHIHQVGYEIYRLFFAKILRFGQVSCSSMEKWQ